ncbi:MAG: S41 family peptidase [Gemmatimonadaceae bacterium]
MQRIIRFSFPAVLFACIARFASAQTAPTPCNCQMDLDSLVTKIEANYIAFRFEVAGTPKEKEYRSLVARLHERAAATSDEDCVFLLRTLTDWFHDGHLFIFQLPAISDSERVRLAASAETRPIDEADLRRKLSSKASRLDPIEGIWYTVGYRVGIVPDESRSPGDFVAIVLQSDSASWQRGQVKARFHRLRDGSYRTVAYADDHSRRDVTSRLYRDVLLNITPTHWGRAFPLAPHQSGTLDPVDPSRPTVRLVGSDAVVISVPSHDPSYTPALVALMRQFRDSIIARPYLLVDIRGDLGGGSQTTAPIVPFFVSHNLRPPIGPLGLSYVVSSKDNIGYFERGWNPDSVAERMTRAPGQLLPLMRNEELGMPFPNDTVLALPRRVGVLMDRGVASAGEAFLLQARRSTKVTLYGDNSLGMIDYQSVQVVRLACRARGNLLGYPMIAASRTLPKDGLNAKGIPPDVRIAKGVMDQVSWVLGHMRAGKHD